MAKILFAVDDAVEAQETARSLRLCGHEVRLCTRAESVLELVRRREFDVVLVVYRMARAKELALLRSLRAEGDRIGILVLAPRVGSAEKVCLLRAGADGYLAQPFSVGELDARIEAVLRRSSDGGLESANSGSSATFPAVSAPAVEFQVLERRLVIYGIPVRLTPTETKILEVLIGASANVVEWTDVRQKVWGSVRVGSIDPHISRLRDKLGLEAWRLETVKGVGLRFLAPSSGRPKSAA